MWELQWLCSNPGSLFASYKTLSQFWFLIREAGLLGEFKEAFHRKRLERCLEYKCLLLLLFIYTFMPKSFPCPTGPCSVWVLGPLSVTLAVPGPCGTPALRASLGGASLQLHSVLDSSAPSSNICMSIVRQSTPSTLWNPHPHPHSHFYLPSLVSIFLHSIDFLSLSLITYYLFPSMM